MDARSAPVRVGDTVRRVAGSSAPAVRELLLHLEAVGFDGAPRHLGTDQQGREVLSWIEGDVPLPPYPRWARTDQALVDLGALARRLHEATASFAPREGWAIDWADPRGGPVICHNDLYPENVVFRDGRVVALVDFAVAAPGRPLWDVAIAAEIWCPLSEPARRDDAARDLDASARFGVLARAYGLAPGSAAELVDIVIEERAQAIGNVRAEIAVGNASWIANWAAAGGDERATADDASIAANRSRLVVAAGG
jgi:aminoglycoside phosphotransferase (APT) family kinase protein